MYSEFMLKKAEVPQEEMEFVTIGSLVPDDHLLRKIDAAVDFEFIRERVQHLYCLDNGRPALDPVMLFKLLFIGYLFGIRSERQLMREVQVNAAYRWFLHLRLQDKVPDASTLSQTRRRRFLDSDIYQQIFDEIVELACRKGLVTGEVLYTDSTHLKASANKNKFDVQRVEVKPVEYLAQLEEAISEDRAAHGKRELKTKASEPEAKEISSTSTIAPSMAATPSLPTPMSHLPTCTIQCRTWGGWTGNASASVSKYAQWDSTQAMRRQRLQRDWKIATSTA